MAIRAVRAALAFVIVCLSSPAFGTFHLMKIREVFPGTTGQPDVEYVALQMYQSGQSQVQGHGVQFYDAAGTQIGSATFAMNVANDANQTFILLATTQAEMFFSITADLVMPSDVIDPTGGMVCFDDIDCVSWGAYAGSATSPSPSGTPFGPNGGISPGHAIRRDISHGNGSMLQGGDDSDDSFDDFDCAATATPTNNAGMSGSYTDPSPCPVCGNNTTELGEVCDGSDDLACPGGCLAECLCPTHDAVVLPVKPIKVKVPAEMPMSVTKKVKVKVRNGDTHNGSDSIKLTATTGDCPPGVTVTTPDFSPPSLDDTVNLGSGESAKAVALVTVTESAFATFNAKALKRCTLQFTASTDVAGNLDPRSSNDSTPLELNVYDENDPDSVSGGMHESYLLSMKPLKITVAEGSTSKAKKAKPAVGNADLLPAPDAGDSISLSVDVSSCSGVTVTTLDADKGTDGNQTSVLVDGGAVAKGLVVFTASSAGVTTPNPASPQRCLATLSATGPSDPDPDTTNNDAVLVIDVVDKNDL